MKTDATLWRPAVGKISSIRHYFLLIQSVLSDDVDRTVKVIAHIYFSLSLFFPFFRKYGRMIEDRNWSQQHIILSRDISTLQRFGKIRQSDNDDEYY